jgi:hypothetical protein
MTAIIAALVPLIGAAAAVLGLAVFAVTRDVAAALPVFLDLLLVAGLLHLSATATWGAIGSAALIVAIRKVAMKGITLGRRARERVGELARPAS